MIPFRQKLFNQIPWRYLIALPAANLALLLPDASPLRVTGALLLIGFLPGLSWSNRLLASYSNLLRWTTAAALSFSLTTLITLLLHGLPGPVQTWQLVAALNAAAVLPLVTIIKTDYTNTNWRQNLPPALVVILLVALFLRVANLNYSEFQGDEALAMIAAAEMLEGHEDALFLRSKGPAEVLLPAALWRLTGTINEASARLPFALVALLAVITIYLIGRDLGPQRLGWLAAGFFAFNGFAVAFGRIVQYQALVLWMSAMAFLLTLKWRQSSQFRLVFLAGLCLGTGLLAHYDAILVVPALLWLFAGGLLTTDHRPPATDFLSQGGNRWSAIGREWAVKLKAMGLFFFTSLLTALSFYLPYALNPRSNRTGEYVGGRIGSQLRNNLPDFFHFNTFYSSSYYIILTTLFVFGLLLWLVWRVKWGRGWMALLLGLGLVMVMLYSDVLQTTATLNLSILPFALLLAAAFFALPCGSSGQSLILWLAAPFLGYNFVVALGLTHIYTIVPAWALLAAVGWYTLFDVPHPHRPWLNRISNYALGGLLILSTLFLWNAFVRHNIEYWQDYPNGHLRLFWTPYDELPPAGFFGFAHRTGWKAVGQKIVASELTGDYGSNEEPDVTTWYTRGAPRACDPQPEFYFLANDLIDPVDVPGEVIETNYTQIGQVTLPNHKQMRIMQLAPSSLALGELDEAALSRTFDQTAMPAAFARSARGATLADVNFGNLIKLVGYDVDTRRAVPGGRLPVTLYWQALAHISDGYQVFTHLESESGLAAQADGVPVCWTYPTTEWQPGQIIADQHAIPLSPDVSPGSYRLDIGLYLPDTFERLDVLDEAGNPAGTHVTLQSVEVRK